ncbi:MAG: NADPH-dependent 7-cyano-7-deazaguanine reductase QueF [Gammaproteobacteria bacterium]|nr:NADPH-dependent 7-cyano-7-deazaguanine reductase QueF [Gammaproteobacteria bacterium]NVK88956.1 NADPH-dependent 7-cyano-7-deazaguanine reductase QueF [Gammaproteobacteria bacterium]
MKDSDIPLGKATVYPKQYDPTLLFPVPRQPKRDEIGWRFDQSIRGGDLWTAYEVSWLNPMGKPQVAIVEFEFAQDSPNIVESKSFKLYLNSFNQQVMHSQDEFKATLQRDLEQVCGKSLTRLTFYTLDEFQQMGFGTFEGTCVDDLEVACSVYDYQPQFLTCLAPALSVSETLYSHLLKSNCLITSQPDWASVFIEYQGSKIDPAGLLQYIVSFRNHDEFHEQCVERIYQDIMTHCQPEKLLVMARYTRRGGLDINPWRANYTPSLSFMRLARQ